MSFTTNAKGTSLGRKHKTRKRPTKNKPKTIKKMVIEIKKKKENGNRIIHIDNYLKCQWIKYTNQKTKTSWGGQEHVHLCVFTYYITLLNLPTKLYVIIYY